MDKNNSNGFTLIELLIVIAILGVLAVVVIVAINPAGQLAKARNGGRRSDLRQLANALQSYYVSHLSYPITVTWRGEYNGYPTDYIPGFVASGEVGDLPNDPRPNQAYPPCNNPSHGYIYRSDATGSCYKLLSYCAPEIPPPYSASDPFYDPVRPTWAWMVCAPTGSACCSY